MPHVVLVAHQESVPFKELAKLAGVLQKQVLEHLQPFWQCSATVTAEAEWNRVPNGSWPIVFMNNLPGPLAGQHLQHNGRPIAYVETGPWQSVIASHECLEMIVDPNGQSLLRPTHAAGTLGGADMPIEYLVEICDPCVAPEHAYPIDDVWVSDFVTRQYYQPTQGAARWSFAGRVGGPGQVLPHGYLTWYNLSDGRWYQSQADAAGTTSVVHIPAPDVSGQPARLAIDRLGAVKRHACFASKPRPFAQVGGTPQHCAIDLDAELARHSATFQSKASPAKALAKSVKKTTEKSKARTKEKSQ